MDGRLKLLESGGAVIKQGGGDNKKWKAKAESKGYNQSDDYQDGGKQKRSRYE